MSFYLIYLLKVSIYLLVFYVIYYLLFDRMTFFQANRVYLLLGLALAFILPILNIQSFTPSIPVELPTELNATFESWVMEQHFHEELPRSKRPIISNIWLILYCSGCCVMIARLSLSVARIISIKNSAKPILLHEKKVYVNNTIQPFSFLSFVFIPNEKTDPLILEHENTHVYQAHWLDLLLMELVIITLWFNPVTYVYKKAIQNVHEYLADNSVVKKSTDMEGYLQCLLKSFRSKTQNGLIINFNSKPILKRITMITKSQTSKVYYLVYVVIVPVIFVLLTSFSSKENKLSFIPNKSTTPYSEEPNFSNAQDAIPSISPVKNATISSGYGMRMHPLEKKLMLHNGVDLKLPAGETVFATADGKVVESKYQDKRGNIIVIKHNEEYTTSYSHMKIRNVSVGDNVQQGQEIGQVGSTGASTAPHLHYEVIKEGVAVDPLPYLNKK